MGGILMDPALSSGIIKKDIQKTIILLNILILFLSIILFVLISIFGIGDCDKLRFEINGTKLKADKFMELYSDKCLVKKSLMDLSDIYPYPSSSSIISLKSSEPN